MLTQLNEWFQEKGLMLTDSMQLARVLPDPCAFLRKLDFMIDCFLQGTAVVNANTGFLCEVLAALLEAEVSCTNSTVYTLVNNRIIRTRRGAESIDTLTYKVAGVLATIFGKASFLSDQELFFDSSRRITYIPVPPSGCRGWQKQRAYELLMDLNVHGVQPVMDADSEDTITTLDGWTWSFSNKTWTRNTLRTAHLRVCGKTREQLELPQEHADAIALLWAKIRQFELAGGRSISGESMVSQDCCPPTTVPP